MSAVKRTQTAHSGQIRRALSEHGVRIVTERVPHMHSVSVGVYVDVGSVDESTTEAGAAHFLEHLLFKGTETRSAMDIASEIEQSGGDSNAYTTKECTCFHARVLDVHQSSAVDVLLDMVLSAACDPKEMKLERDVVLEEIAMYEDEPDELIFDDFHRAVYGEHPLALPILGSAASLAELQRDDVYEFYRKHYVPENLVVAAAGNLDHDALVEQVRSAAFGHFVESQRRTRRQIAPVSVQHGVVRHREKPTDQVHIVCGAEAFARGDDRRFALNVLNQILGGGMSSRLFQEIREKRGLAYTVNTFASLYANSGVAGVYAGCTPQHLDTVISLIQQELERVAQDGVSDEELFRGVGMVTGAVLLDLEDSAARMELLGRREVSGEEFVSVDEQLERYRAVTREELQQLAREVYGQKLSFVTLGAR